jgi:hypothetical protein
MPTACLNCQEPLSGRKDKKFCSSYCKSNYHYEEYKAKEQTLFKKIDRQLKLNRKLLNTFNRAGKATIRASDLSSQGFDPNYFTHYWKNTKGDVYLFCYEFGFLKRTENAKVKYILVRWQNYMVQS